MFEYEYTWQRYENDMTTQKKKYGLLRINYEESLPRKDMIIIGFASLIDGIVLIGTFGFFAHIVI